MLKHDLQPKRDEMLDMIDQMNGNNELKQLEPGFWLGGINFGNRITLADRDKIYRHEVPWFGEEFHRLVPGTEDDPGYFFCYGVCDSPQQFIDRFKKLLEEDERTFVVSFGHIKKEPEKAGKGGGWRWHKWGRYIGDGKPQCEYLDDEEFFADGVYVYHVYQVDGPIYDPPQWLGRSVE